jgi:glutamyl-tRNA reductase
MVSLQTIDQKLHLAEREIYIKKIKSHSLNEGVFLQTCNRVELYSGGGYIPQNIINHLFRVVAGLESSLVGETAIQGQVKDSYLSASMNYRLDKSLHKLFQTALYVGKKVRSETSISQGAVSHSQAAVNIICRSFKEIGNSRITVIGVHNINANIIRYLTKKGTGTIFIGNRTYDKAKALSIKFGCQVFRFDELKKILGRTDILISATSAPHLIIKPDIFPKNRKMFIIDLAVPRDIDENIGSLKDVNLINIEMLERMVEQNIDKRKNAIENAEQIVSQEVERLLEWQKN